MRQYLFVDEAGNFDFSARGSRYFILTSITMATCAVGHELLELRRRLAWDGLPLLAEFHASEETQSVRDHVFGLLDAHEFRIDATIIDKRKVRPHLAVDESLFYKTAWYLHAKYLLGRVGSAGGELLVVSATLGTKKRQQSLSTAVNDVILQTAGHLDVKTAFWSAASEPCLQVADYCSWAIQRKWERADNRSYLLIADKIASEFDVFASSTTTFY